MEQYITISHLNDFVFCPRSVYFHQLYGSCDKSVFQERSQVAGTLAHNSIDTKAYSTKKDILQALDVYSEKYKLCGKIDLFDVEQGKLIERKKEIKHIYDGYIFQVYAQYHALVEMGYKVNSIVIRDITHNKNYPIGIPPRNESMQKKFEALISEMNKFSIDSNYFKPVENKCKKCIYSNLCDYSLC